jgi:hypothetical protein
MQPNYPTTAAPTRPFPVGPFLVTPRPIPVVCATRYRVEYLGQPIGEQLSYPNLEQCADMAVKAFGEHRIEGDTLKAIRTATADFGYTLRHAPVLVHSAPTFNNVKRRPNPNDPEKMTHICDTCEVEKPLTGFFKNGAGRRQTECRSCVIRAASERKARA